MPIKAKHNTNRKDNFILPPRSDNTTQLADGNKCNESTSTPQSKFLDEFDSQPGNNITSPLREGGFKLKTIKTAVSTIKCIDVSDMTANQIYKNYAEICDGKLDYMAGNGRVYLIISEVIKTNKR